MSVDINSGTVPDTIFINGTELGHFIINGDIEFSKINGLADNSGGYPFLMDTLSPTDTFDSLAIDTAGYTIQTGVPDLYFFVFRLTGDQVGYSFDSITPIDGIEYLQSAALIPAGQFFGGVTTWSWSALITTAPASWKINNNPLSFMLNY